MEPKNFVIWLSGFLEACGDSLSETQTKVIIDKLNGIFEHEADIVHPISLEDLGEKHNFPVIPGFPNQQKIGEDEEGTYRC